MLCIRAGSITHAHAKYTVGRFITSQIALATYRYVWLWHSGNVVQCTRDGVYVCTREKSKKIFFLYQVLKVVW